MASIDDEIRAAAIAKALQLRDQYGGRIPRAALAEGVYVRGERIPLWNQYRGIHKPAAFGRDGAALSIHTSVDSPYDDEHDADAGQIIYKYQGDSPSNADNVALRRAMELEKPLIYLVAVDPGFYDAVIPVYVTSDNPGKLQFALAADQAASTVMAADPVKTAARREYATRAVLIRLHQQKFRRAVLSAYRDQCCICRLRHVELLDAAHILVDRHPKGEPIVSNGLGLCKIHHSAYDSHILGIDAEARVHVREDILEEKDGPMLRHGLQETAGTQLALPRRADHQPNKDFLAERFARFLAA